jgi:hypothetical protein
MVTQIAEALRQKDYLLFIRPFELNIVGERSQNATANSFDDKMHVFYKTEDDAWMYHCYPCTTDPGTYWLNSPMNEEGTAILVPGQYLNCYSIGLHKQKYEALRQVRPITVVRDHDRNSILDFDSAKKDTGIFGVNIHRASAWGTTKCIDKYSAGCQVFQNADDFAAFMAMCHQHAKRYDNSFTYTLLA